MTSSNRSLLHFAAEAYGGEVQEWDDDWAPHDEYGRPTQYELYTTANAMKVLIPTFSAISLSFERWSASGCQQRCTGEMITECPLNEALVGAPCNCPADDGDRADLAKEGKACARVLRLNVLLPDLPGVGCWLLQTKGYYATAELMGTLDMLQMAGQEHQIIEAVLRLEQRQVKRVGKGEGTGTLQFAVPVLWPQWTPRQILSGAAQVLLATPEAPVLPTLPEPIQALYGDHAAPAGEAGLPYIAQLEAAILAQPGWEVEPWYVWAERRFKKSRVQFTTEDYATFLQAVRDRVAQQAQEGVQERAGATQTPEGGETPPAPPEAPESPGSAVEGYPTFQGTDPDLFKQMDEESGS